MDWKRLYKTLLFPPIAIMVALVPVSAALLIYSMVVLGAHNVVSYISYVVSAYTLTVWGLRLPWLIRLFKKIKKENKYVQRWFSDARLRINVSLYFSLACNAVYGVFQVWLGFYYSTFWFYSLGAYYICLALMRFGLVRYSSKYKPGEKLRTELIKYRMTGVIFLLMNIAISLMIFFMVYWNRSYEYHMIMAITMAAYTFASFAVAIVNMVRYSRYNSPVFSSTAIVSLACACVSVLTLESAMLTTFDDGSMDWAAKHILLAISGGAVSVFIIAMAIYMIVDGTKKLKSLNSEDKYGKQ